MPKSDLDTNVRTMNRRYEAHLLSGNHLLRAGSQQEMGHSTVAFFKENDPETKQLNTNGHQVAPGGLGKTVWNGDFIVGINTMPNGRFVLEDPTLQKRVLIAVPSNALVDRWADEFLGEFDEDTGKRGPSVFSERFNASNIGVYHANLTDEEKREVLSKPVVIAVHDSIQILCASDESSPHIRPEYFHALIIDEVDDKVRGDVTRSFYQDVFFPHCMVVGCTATQLFKSGKTIGDYLFGGKKPICEITHEEAVMRREIAPHINIIVERDIDPRSNVVVRHKPWEDYSDQEKLRLIEQTGTDNALLDSIKHGRHPKTGKPLREMLQLHKAVNVEHAKRVAQQLNEAFGSGYAEVIYGEDDGYMDNDIRSLITSLYRSKDIKAVVQCKLWGRGVNFPELELTVQHAPGLSPNDIIQFHTRASRRHDGKKVALYMSPYINGIDQLVVGELLGGLYMVPDGFEYGPTQGNVSALTDPDLWPNIQGLKVHHTQRQLALFAEERQKMRYVNGLPIKPGRMLALDEMARTLGIDQEILESRVYTPLQQAFDMRQARLKFVDIEADSPRHILYVRGKMFPINRLGVFQHRGQEKFCVDQDLLVLCEHTLYGRLDKTPPEMLGRENSRRLLGFSNAQIDTLRQKLQQAFFQRIAYDQHVVIDGINFSYDSFAFYRNSQGRSEFFISPDALIPSYRLITGADKSTVEQWSQQPRISQCKTSEWLTLSETMDFLDISPLVDKDRSDVVKSIFDTLKSQSRKLQVGVEREAGVRVGKKVRTMRFSRRWLPLAPGKEHNVICIHFDSLEDIKQELGIESRHDQAGSKAWTRPTKRGRQPAP